MIKILNKILSVLFMLCFFINISFAFDSYADDEIEKKSYKKLCYGIVLTLLGGFLAYDGFSTEEVDISKPSVDYTTVLHSEWVQKGQNGSEVQNEIGGKYILRSGYTDNITAGKGEDYTKYKIDGEVYTVEQNILYNNGNVDLTDLTIEVRYKYDSGTIIKDENPGEHSNNGTTTNDGYHVAKKTEEVATKTEVYENLTLKKGDTLTWRDVWEYSTAKESPPNRNERQGYIEEGEHQNDGTTGLNLGKDGLYLMDIRVKIDKKNYTPIYEKRHKSEIEGVAGIMVGLAGIYFIIDHFIDMHKFNNYAKKHDLNFKILTASNEYKLMLQKRI